MKRQENFCMLFLKFLVLDIENTPSLVNVSTEKVQRNDPQGVEILICYIILDGHLKTIMYKPKHCT